ncbi:MAG: hypothetical protein JO329_26295 [Planctomycetaceae bacterium]|nr:hypothetical protein [Planctomycetaceae bacterium]
MDGGVGTVIGGFEAAVGTVLLTANEGQAAMLQARSVQTGYRPPEGYASHG